jgi:hypothetical protein
LRGAEGGLGGGGLFLRRLLALLGGEEVLPRHALGGPVARIHGRGVDASAAVEGAAVRAGEEAGGAIWEGDRGEGDKGRQDGAGGGVGDVAVDELLLCAREGDDGAELNEGGIGGEVSLEERAERGNGTM